MYSKTHQKTVSSDSQANMIQNYFSQNSANRQPYNFQLDFKHKQQVQSLSPTLQERVETFMRQTKPKTTITHKTNYSIVPTSSKLNPLLRQQKSQNQIMSKQQMSTMNQRTDVNDTSNKFSQVLMSFVTPKQSSGFGSTQFKSPLSSPSLKRPESSLLNNFNSQSNSHHGSKQKISKIVEEKPKQINENDVVVQRNIMSNQKNLKIGLRKNSEDIQYKLSFEHSLKSVKSQLIKNQLQSGHLKTQSVQLMDNHMSSNLSAQESSMLMQKIKYEIDFHTYSDTKINFTKPLAKPMITLLINYQHNTSKYMLDTTKYDIKSLIEFVKKEIEQQDQTVRGLIIGIRTSNLLVPIDYLLSRPNLPLSILYHHSAQLSVEPMINTIPKEIGKKVTLKDFYFIRCIGHGGFSQVYLVREKITGQYFAMKLVQKNHILGQGKQSIIQCERDIMSAIEHPFLVKMNYAFESRKYLVFVLEYCSGGELFFLLKKVKRMTEKQAFFYFAEICLGMKHLHDNQIVYRDIKPENILIDFDGHVRIADFGLSKPNMEPNDVAYSFCGSPEYMAPEMLLKSGHSFKLDIYCLGALLYELITGLPPFYSRNTDEIYQRILNQKLSFPASVKISPQLKDLLQSLLVKNPKNRISDLNGIFSHPWNAMHAGADTFYNIEQKKINPPFAPDPYNFNFDEEEFGQGETEFLLEMRQIQEQQSENYPKQIVLPNFYYTKMLHSMNKIPLNNKRFQEGTGGTESQQKIMSQAERFMSVQMTNSPYSDHKQQLSQRSGKQTKLILNERFNTVEDGQFKQKISFAETPKPVYQSRPNDLKQFMDTDQKRTKN